MNIHKFNVREYLKLSCGQKGKEEANFNKLFLIICIASAFIFMLFIILKQI